MRGLLKKNHYRLGLVAALGLAMGTWMAMGCGSSSATSSDTSSTDTSSLATVPTTDVSSYDPTTSSSSSSNLSVKSLSKSLAKAVGSKAASNKYDTRHEGVPSRAGCEQNMQKKEIIRHSQQAQLDRCYIEAFEKAGIITIPTDGSRKAYGFIPPAEEAEDRSKKCSGIPAERSKERDACLNGKEGPSGGSVAARVGIIDGALQIDVCSGASLSALTLENESTYTGGATPSFKVIRKGKHGGNDEGSTISGALSGVTSISDGNVTLSADGKAAITASMSGSFGSGSMSFEANTLRYILSGGFKGAFKDPFSESETSFTGKAYAIVGKSASTDTSIKGTAKFSFTGAPPAMALQNIIPFDVAGPSQLENFLKTFGAEMGITLTLSNYKDIYICPNPNFDPENPSVGVKPMVAVAKGVACSTVTHTGVDSFEVTNIEETGNFGKKIEQTFSTIDNSSSPFATEVAAKDLSTISADAATIAFERKWDCGGISATLDMTDPGALSSDAASKLQAGMESCSALEERGRDEGMGGHNCGGQEMGNVAENIKDDPPSFGNAGGDYVRGAQIESSCAAPGSSNRDSPERFFVNVVDSNDNEYCVPVAGECESFTVSSSTVSGLNVEFSPNLKITQIAYGAGTGVSTKATTATVTFTASRDGFSTTCTENYTITQPSFDKPSGPPPLDQFPSACKAAGITDQGACGEFCHRPENKGCMDD